MNIDTLKTQIRNQERTLAEMKTEHEGLNVKLKGTTDKKMKKELSDLLDTEAIDIAKLEASITQEKEQLAKLEEEEKEKLTSSKSLINSTITDVCDDFDIQSMFSGIELSTSDFEEITESDFEGFGLMSSKEYKKRLDDLTTGMLAMDKMMVMVLCVAVKNKNRIMNSLKRFESKTWYKNVREFFDRKTVQYTSEVTSPSIMPVVNIPTCNPPLAVIAWLLINDRWSVRAFMCNLWSGQLALSTALQREHRRWEEYFWEVTVRKSKSAAFERGFHEDYYVTKESDKYPLMDMESQLWFMKEKCKTTGAGYEKSDIQTYLVKMASMINKAVGRTLKVVVDNSGEALISDSMYARVTESKEKRKKEEEDKAKK